MNRRRTIRWTKVENPERLMQALLSHSSLTRCEVVTIFDCVYARGVVRESLLEEAEFRGGWFLADQTEVFVLQAPDATIALELASTLGGAGGLSAITEVKVVQSEILIELAGNPTRLFAFVDEFIPHDRITRRALLTLYDTTLIAVAAFGWNTSDLDTLRILEVAAGEDTW